MIKVFGEKAREIEDGQIFIARVDSIEGRSVVTLEPSIKYDADSCPYKEIRFE